MSDVVMRSDVSTGSETALPNPRKQYVRPAILSRESLEATAGACAGGKTDSASCSSGPVSS